MGAYKGFLTAVLLTVVVLTGLGYTQSNSIKDITAHKYALENLIADKNKKKD